LVISEAVKSKFPARQRRRYAAKFRTVTNGIDPAAIDAASADRPRFGLASDDFVLLTAGTVTHRKGVDRLLTVLPDLVHAVPNAVLAVAGEPAGDEDRKYAASLPNRNHPAVRWLGQRDDLPILMKSCDLFCLPSRTEGMGRVLVEAMFASRPCIGSRAGGIPEVIVDGETGLLFDGEDREDLLRSRIVLANDPDRRRRMGEAGRSRAETQFHGPTQIAKVVSEILALAEANPDATGPRRPAATAVQ
ncbi:MAG: glycosyltransferase family 4 protein, partial [Planctomycetota bacterium]